MIVGFGHVARVGKDTAAQALVRDLGFRQVSFAEPLKRIAMGSDPIIVSEPRTINTNAGRGRLKWVVESLGSWETAKDQYMEVRPYLQRLGVAIRNELGDDIWVRHALKGVTPEDRIVISDVRFQNEAWAIHEKGGKVFRINRPGHMAAGHVSETELLRWNGWDHEFDNTAGVAELERDVVQYVKGLLK